jgi:hypothetical protein
MRDIEAAYKDALIEEYEGYRRAGRTEDAEHVADILKDRYGHSVASESKGDDGKAAAKEAPQPAEKADMEKPSENATDPKPRRTPRVKPSQGEEK